MILNRPVRVWTIIFVLALLDIGILTATLIRDHHPDPTGQLSVPTGINSPSTITPIHTPTPQPTTALDARGKVL